MRTILAFLLTSIAVPALSHNGSTDIHWHFFEHILLALVIGVPAAFGLARLVMRRGKTD